jgi:hypothetical protein
VRRDPTLFAVVWGVATWAFSVPQNQILPGGPNWHVEAGHLVSGAIAIVLGVVLASAVAKELVPVRSSVS